MKKFLAATSTLALATAFSTNGSAAEWEVRVGGYFESYAAFAASDVNGIEGEFDGVDSKRDAEIAFLPSITLDNGLKIGANIQLEGSSGTPDKIDESFLFIDGSFGRILLGSENSAGYLMQYGAPDVTFINVNSGSMTAFVPFSGAVTGRETGFTTDVTVGVGSDVFRGTLGSTFLENGRNNDAERITYFTPRFAGFQLGVSYARDGDQDDNSQQNIDQRPLANIFDIGANYVNSFGDFSVASSARWGIAAGAGDSNPTVHGFGLNLGYAGFTIGGSWAEQNNSEGGGTSGDRQDGTSYDLGLSYETGPWGFSFTYFRGENVDNENAFATTGNDETLDMFLIGANYKLAKGVSLGAFGAYVDFDEETGDAFGPSSSGGDDVDGFVIGTGISLSF